MLHELSRNSLMLTCRVDLYQRALSWNILKAFSCSTENTVKWVFSLLLCLKPEIDCQWISVKKLNIFSSWFLLMLCFSSGHSGCDGQPSVSFGGDSLENILEVQWKSGRRLGNTSCVSLLLSTTKSNTTCQDFSIFNSLDSVCFPFKVFQTLF